MDVANLNDQQLADLISAVDWSNVDRGEAAQVLRATVKQCHESEAALEKLKGAIACVEAALVYGPSGRPVRPFPASWEIQAGFNSFGDEPAAVLQPAKAGEIDVTAIESSSKEVKIEQPQPPLTERENYLLEYLLDKLQRAGKI